MLFKLQRFLRNRSRRGLTLAELAIVVLVLGVIMGIVVYSLRSAKDVIGSAQKIKVSQFQANQLPLELDRFRAAGGVLNPGEDLTPMLQDIPDSSFKAVTEDLIMDPWNHPYFICQGDDGSDRICSRGRDGRDGGEGEDADFKLDDRSSWPDWLKKK